MKTYMPRCPRSWHPKHREDLLMEDLEVQPGQEFGNGLVANPPADLITEELSVGSRAEAGVPETAWRYEDEGSLLNAGFTVELRNVKTAMVIAPNHPVPICVEGLLLSHRSMPLAAEMEVILAADDREVVRERFFLPTNRRAEVMAAHRELAQISSDFLHESRMRDTAMSVYFPELSEEYDLWYRISIDENGTLSYKLHLGPSDNQDVKKCIEGTVQL
jgi:hypothetical protein